MGSGKRLAEKQRGAMNSETGMFTQTHLGDVLTCITILVGIIALRADFNKRSDEQRREREDLLEAQTKMHTENRMKLDSLAEFKESQQEVNAKRDVQIGELQKQTATIAEIAKGMDRRLQMIEDRIE